MKRIALALAALAISASAFAGNGLGPAGTVGSGTGPYSFRPDSVEKDGHAHGVYPAAYPVAQTQDGKSAVSYAAFDGMHGGS